MKKEIKTINWNDIFSKILKININFKLNETIILINSGENLYFNNYNFIEQKSMDYCPYCEKDNTLIHKLINHFKCLFLHDKISQKCYFNFWNYPDNERLEEIIFYFVATCAMDLTHKIYYSFSINSNGEIFKFSEYPYDLVLRKTQNPNHKLLKKLKLDKLLNKAYSASSNNLYIGSFVYIRRVIEGLVEKIANDNKIDISSQKKLGEKINSIKHLLPEFVKQNIKNFSNKLGYSIHNLEEEAAAEIYQFMVLILNLFIHHIEYKINVKKDEKKMVSFLNKKDKKN